MKFELPWTKWKRRAIALERREVVRAINAMAYQRSFNQAADRLNAEFGERPYFDHIFQLQWFQSAIYVKNRRAMETLCLPKPD